MKVYLDNAAIELLPDQLLGSGGEADVFDIGQHRVAKVFKSPGHPDLDGSPFEQQAAKLRLAEHQTKLNEFPSGLPSSVVTPLGLLRSAPTGPIVGYVMKHILGAEPAAAIADPRQRKGRFDGNTVVQLLRETHQVLSKVHQAGAVVGDFNDLNILISNGHARLRVHLIDADSFQFGRYACTVFTDRYVDPRLCTSTGPLTPQTAFSTDSDWYAFAVFAMRSLLCVGPYGGMHQPKSGKRMTLAQRKRNRLTVFDHSVRYPRPALALETLPQALLDFFRETFVKDRRGPFPMDLLETLRFVDCTQCGYPHAAHTCPECAHRSIPKPIVKSGNVKATLVFEADGPIVAKHALTTNLVYKTALPGGHACFYDRTGTPIVQALWREKFDWSVGDLGMLAVTQQRATLYKTGQPPRVFQIDRGEHCTGYFGENLFWVEAGTLWRTTTRDPWRPDREVWGSVLRDQTSIWLGSEFGFGFYKAGALASAFVFGRRQSGIRDGLTLPIPPGALIDSRCAIDGKFAWLLLTSKHRGKLHRTCSVFDRAGRLHAHLECGEDSRWHESPGQLAANGALLSASDAGLVRHELDRDRIILTRTFPNTAQWVNGACLLSMGRHGLDVIDNNKHFRLKLE